MSNPFVVINQEKKKQLCGTTLYDFQISYPGCYLEWNDVEIRVPEYVLENGVTYVLKLANQPDSGKRTSINATSFSIEGLRKDEPFIDRKHLIDKIVDKMNEKHFAVVCGPPATGKTALCCLLRHRLPNAIVVHIPLCSNIGGSQDVLLRAGFDIRRGAHTLDKTATTIFVLDEAHRAYPDVVFWKDLMMSITNIPRCWTFLILATTFAGPNRSVSPVAFKDATVQDDMFLSKDESDQFVSIFENLLTGVVDETNQSIPFSSCHQLLSVMINDCGGHVGALRLMFEAVRKNFHANSQCKEDALIRFYLSYECLQCLGRCFNYLLLEKEEALSFSRNWKNPSPGTIDRVWRDLLLYNSAECDISDTHLDDLISCNILEKDDSNKVQFRSLIARRYFCYHAYPNRASPNSFDFPNLEALIYEVLRKMPCLTINQSWNDPDKFPLEAVFQQEMKLALASLTPPDCAICTELSFIFPALPPTPGIADASGALESLRLSSSEKAQSQPQPQSHPQSLSGSDRKVGSSDCTSGVTVANPKISKRRRTSFRTFVEEQSTVEGNLDLMVEGSYGWGIELLNSGDKIAEHISRFAPGGKYYALRCQQYVVIDFRENKPNTEVHIQTMEHRCTVLVTKDKQEIRVKYGTGEWFDSCFAK